VEKAQESRKKECSQYSIDTKNPAFAGFFYAPTEWEKISKFVVYQNLFYVIQ
jgi:hypothetical protein